MTRFECDNFQFIIDFTHRLLEFRITAIIESHKSDVKKDQRLIRCQKLHVKFLRGFEILLRSFVTPSHLL